MRDHIFSGHSECYFLSPLVVHNLDHACSRVSGAESLLVKIHSQTAPYVSFNGVNLPNHGYVDLSLVGDPLSGGDAVQCHTDIQYYG